MTDQTHTSANDVTATVIIPTTADRRPVLHHAIESLRRQTVTNFEAFVIGDGAAPATADMIDTLAQDDPRFTFVGFPKHARRGEPHRHQLLTERAQGRFVAYLADRDVWFRNHLETVDRLLATADIAATLWFRVEDDDTFSFPDRANIEQMAAQRTRVERHLAPLSTFAHTMTAYRGLPEGWATTPSEHSTDSYMWQKFVRQPGIRAAFTPLPTALWLRRGAHPGPPIEERAELSRRWMERMATPSDEFALSEAILTALWEDRWRLERRSPSYWIREMRRELKHSMVRVGLRRR